MEWTVGELSRRSGISISAIHFYERKGLIASRRTTGNQRRYEKEVLRRISIIRIAQEVGIPLAEVAHHFGSLPKGGNKGGNKGGHATRRDWERISRLWANDLDRRIATLQKLRVNLGDCIGCGCLSLDRCNLLNPDDRLSSKGTGPARLKARRSFSN